MRFRLLLPVIAMLLAACSPGPAISVTSPSPSPTGTPVPATPSPAQSPLPVAQVACRTGVSSVPMVLMGGPYEAQRLIYDVSDPLHPRLLCRIAGTSVHLFTGDTFEYLKPVSPTETDVMLHSLGSGNEIVAGRFPFSTGAGDWWVDASVIAYTTPVSADDANFPAGGTKVWLYSDGRAAPLATYRNGFGDCICRFGLPAQVLRFSPDGQYLVAGRMAGKGSEPLAVYRVADRSLVATFDQNVMSAFWDHASDRLFLESFGADPARAWTPSGGVTTIAGAAGWTFLPGQSPDGGQVSYTAYADPAAMTQPRVYVIDLKTATTRTLVDKPRTQVLFVKDGWIWFLEERVCAPADGCAGGTAATGKVFAMRLASGGEAEVTFDAGENPVAAGGSINPFAFAPGELWPNQ